MHSGQRRFSMPPNKAMRFGEEPPRESVQGSPPQRRGRNGPVAPSMEDRMDKMFAALEQLQQQNAQLLQQLAAVQAENAHLRQLLSGLSLPQQQPAFPMPSPVATPADDHLAASSAHASGAPPGHGL